MNIRAIIKKKSTALIVSCCLLLIGISCIIKTSGEPVKDFGNYYYGSKLLAEGKFSIDIYKSMAFFNDKVGRYGEQKYFVNYTPVPPFSALFYLPFTSFESGPAKMLFNLLSLLVFCFSVFRLIKHFSPGQYFSLFLPFMFFIPIYNNILQGQSYLLITALLAESLIASRNNRIHPAALCLALCISLKLFPAFMLMYFLIKKDYKTLLWTSVYLSGIFVLTALAIDWQILQFYFLDILPRLFNNDVIGTYHQTNQSVYSFLLNLLSFDAINNASPVYNLPQLVPLIEGACMAALISLLIKASTKGDLFVFGLTSFISMLVSRYNPSYSLVLLLPLFLAMDTESIDWPAKLVFALIFAGALYLPVGTFSAFAPPIKYARLLLLIIVLLVVIKQQELTTSAPLFFTLFVPLLIFRYFTFSIQPVNYFQVQNSRGILINSQLRGDSLILKSISGEIINTETYGLNGRLKEDEQLYVKDNQIVYKGQTLTNSPDNKQQAYLFRDSIIVFMSDMNQAVGFYKLRTFPLH